MRPVQLIDLYVDFCFACWWPGAWRPPHGPEFAAGRLAAGQALRLTVWALQEVLESLSCEPSKTHLPGKATRQDTKDIPSWQLLVALCRCEFWSALHRRGSPGSHIFLALYCNWFWLGSACLQYLPVWCSHWTFHEFDCPPGRSGGVSNFSAGVDPFINIPG